MLHRSPVAVAYIDVLAAAAVVVVVVAAAAALWCCASEHALWIYDAVYP